MGGRREELELEKNQQAKSNFVSMVQFATISQTKRGDGRLRGGGLVRVLRDRGWKINRPDSSTKTAPHSCRCCEDRPSTPATRSGWRNSTLRGRAGGGQRHGVVEISPDHHSSVSGAAEVG